MQVLSSREAVPHVVLSAYRPLLAGMSRERFAEALLPALLRVVKRSPDVMLPVAEAVLGMLTLDLSLHAEALMKDLEQQLRHQKDSVRCGVSCRFTSTSLHPGFLAVLSTNRRFNDHRAGAVRCLRAAAGKVREADALSAMFAVAEGLLSGGGKLRNVQERAAVVGGVGALSAAPGRSQGKVALAGRVVALLCGLYGCAFPPWPSDDVGRQPTFRKFAIAAIECSPSLCM